MDTQQVLQPVNKKTGPKDVFLHLLAIIALYASAVSLTTLLFQYINIALLDALDGGYYALTSIYQSIRFALSSLIVLFPVFVFTSRFLQQEYVADPEKRDTRIRKWLLYFTLFLAGFVILGDLVTLLYNFLDGELTKRFLLKILVVLFVAGAIFWHYFAELKEYTSGSVKVFRYLVIAIVAVVAIEGFFVAGSPTEQRARRFDEQRVADLQTIQWQIVNYWQNKQKLPVALVDLNDDISGFRVPMDPETKTAYEYEVKGPEMFSLCAEFGRPSLQNANIAQPYFEGIKGTNWEHAEGRACFERSIDKDFYKPRPADTGSVPPMKQ